jgi:hypothetical protein
MGIWEPFEEAKNRLDSGPALLGEFPEHLLARSDRLALSLGRRLLVMLPFFQFGEDSGLLALPLESPKSILEGLIFFHVD